MHPRFHVADLSCKGSGLVVAGCDSPASQRRFNRWKENPSCRRGGTRTQQTSDEVVLVEGRNRQIHRMMEAVGVEIPLTGPVRNLTNEVNVGSWRSLSKRKSRACFRGLPRLELPRHLAPGQRRLQKGRNAQIPVHPEALAGLGLSPQNRAEGDARVPFEAKGLHPTDGPNPGSPR